MIKFIQMNNLLIKIKTVFINKNSVLYHIKGYFLLFGIVYEKICYISRFTISSKKIIKYYNITMRI